MFQFEWVEDPVQVFVPGVKAWQREFYLEMISLMQSLAQEGTAFLQSEAPWHNITYKARHGLRAEAFVGDDDTIGIEASYSGAINPLTNEDYSYDLELDTFPRAGVLSIILNRRSPSFLGEFADHVMDRVAGTL